MFSHDVDTMACLTRDLLLCSVWITWESIEPIHSKQFLSELPPPYRAMMLALIKEMFNLTGFAFFPALPWQQMEEPPDAPNPQMVMLAGFFNIGDVDTHFIIFIVAVCAIASTPILLYLTREKGRGPDAAKQRSRRNLVVTTFFVLLAFDFVSKLTSVFSCTNAKIWVEDPSTQTTGYFCNIPGAEPGAQCMDNDPGSVCWGDGHLLKYVLPVMLVLAPYYVGVLHLQAAQQDQQSVVSVDRVCRIVAFQWIVMLAVVSSSIGDCFGKGMIAAQMLSVLSQLALLMGVLAPTGRYRVVGLPEYKVLIPSAVDDVCDTSKNGLMSAENGQVLGELIGPPLGAAAGYGLGLAFSTLGASVGIFVGTAIGSPIFTRLFAFLGGSHPSQWWPAFKEATGLCPNEKAEKRKEHLATLSLDLQEAKRTVVDSSHRKSTRDLTSFTDLILEVNDWLLEGAPSEMPDPTSPDGLDSMELLMDGVAGLLQGVASKSTMDNLPAGWIVVPEDTEIWYERVAKTDHNPGDDIPITSLGVTLRSGTKGPDSTVSISNEKSGHRVKQLIGADAGTTTTGTALRSGTWSGRIDLTGDLDFSMPWQESLVIITDGVEHEVVIDSHITCAEDVRKAIDEALEDGCGCADLALTIRSRTPGPNSSVEVESDGALESLIGQQDADGETKVSGDDKKGAAWMGRLSTARHSPEGWSIHYGGRACGLQANFEASPQQLTVVVDGVTHELIIDKNVVCAEDLRKAVHDALTAHCLEHDDIQNRCTRVEDTLQNKWPDEDPTSNGDRKEEHDAKIMLGEAVVKLQGLVADVKSKRATRATGSTVEPVTEAKNEPEQEDGDSGVQPNAGGEMDATKKITVVQPILGFKEACISITHAMEWRAASRLPVLRKLSMTTRYETIHALEIKADDAGIKRVKFEDKNITKHKRLCGKSEDGHRWTSIQAVDGSPLLEEQGHPMRESRSLDSTQVGKLMFGDIVNTTRQDPSSTCCGSPRQVFVEIEGGSGWVSTREGGMETGTPVLSKINPRDYSSVLSLNSVRNVGLGAAFCNGIFALYIMESTDPGEACPQVDDVAAQRLAEAADAAAAAAAPPEEMDYSLFVTWGAINAAMFFIGLATHLYNRQAWKLHEKAGMRNVNALPDEQHEEVDYPIVVRRVDAALRQQAKKFKEAKERKKLKGVRGKLAAASGEAEPVHVDLYVSELDEKAQQMESATFDMVFKQKSSYRNPLHVHLCNVDSAQPAGLGVLDFLLSLHKTNTNAGELFFGLSRSLKNKQPLMLFSYGIEYGGKYTFFCKDKNAKDDAPPKIFPPWVSWCREKKTICEAVKSMIRRCCPKRTGASNSSNLVKPKKRYGCKRCKHNCHKNCLAWVTEDEKSCFDALICAQDPNESPLLKHDPTCCQECCGDCCTKTHPISGEPVEEDWIPEEPGLFHPDTREPIDTSGQPISLLRFDHLGFLQEDQPTRTGRCWRFCSLGCCASLQKKVYSTWEFALRIGIITS